MATAEGGPLANIGEVIRLLRTRVAWTQSRLAEEAGVTKAQISNYERDREMPTIQSLNKILSALGVTSPFDLAAVLEDAKRSERWARFASGDEPSAGGEGWQRTVQREEALREMQNGFLKYLRLVEAMVREPRS